MIDSRIRYRLALAASLSASVHGAALVWGHIETPEPPRDALPLAVHLVSAPASPPPRAKPELPGRSRPAPARADIVALDRAESYAVFQPQPHSALEVPAVEDPPAAEPVASEPQPPIAIAAPEMNEPAPPPRNPLPDFPRSGHISYKLVYGPDGFPVGRTEQTWRIEGDRYQVASRSETTGIVDLFRSQHRTYLSRGTLTAEGFRPETFLMSRDRGRGTEVARAQFDWTTGSLKLGPASRERMEALPPRSQDLVSFMYQLALDPPHPGTAQVTVTNGARVESYALEIRPEEMIDTPIGVLRALPVRQLPKPGDESVEVWLAADYRHLPVRVRFFGRDGAPAGEQIVTEIRLGEGS